MEVSKIIEWDMGHRVPLHKSKCSNIHGHRYKAIITLEGEIIQEVGSDEGMVIDFGDIKRIAKGYIDKKLDHGYMYYKNDETGKIISQMKKWNGEKMKTIEVDFIPTAENIAKWLFTELKSLYIDRYKNGLHLKKIILYETPNSFTVYEE